MTPPQIPWPYIGATVCDAAEDGTAGRHVVKRLSAGSDGRASPPRAVPLVIVDSGEVIAGGMLLTDSPHTSNRHEWNKP
jgi:hypothetical protein